MITVSISETESFNLTRGDKVTRVGTGVMGVVVKTNADGAVLKFPGVRKPLNYTMEHLSQFIRLHNYARNTK